MAHPPSGPTGHHTGEHGGGEEEIHLPAPSWAPMIIGIGVTLACFGLLFTPLLIALGAVILIGGIALWLIEDARTFADTPDTGGHH